jgi:hypothetical protein
VTLIMPDPLYLLAAVLVAAVVTWTLRAAPLAVLAPIRDSGLTDSSVTTARSG